MVKGSGVPFPTIYPSLIISITVLVSILLFSSINWSGPLLFLLALCICSYALSLLRSNRRRSRILLLAGIGLALAAFSCFRLTVDRLRAYSGIPVNTVSSLRGVIAADSVRTRNGESIHRLRLFSVGSDGIETSARGRIVLYDPSGIQLYQGEITRAVVSMSKAESTIHEDYHAGVSEISSEGFRSLLYRFRAWTLQRLDVQIERLGYPASSLFRGLFLGLKDDISLEMMEGFEKTGTLHVLALSGLHVGIIFLLLITLMKPINSTALRWVAAILILSFYVFLVGPKASLVRASLVLVVSGFTIFLDRDPQPLNILGLVLLILLFFDPGSAFSVSFQLSFLAASGILLFGRPIFRQLQPYVPAFLNAPFSFTLGAQLAVLPLTILYFGKYYPVGIIATPLLLPFITIFLWTGIILLPLTMIPLVGLKTLGIWIMQALYRVILFIVRLFSRFPGLTGNSFFLCCSVLSVLVLLGLCFQHRKAIGRWVKR
jgi:ComEC/Rec2-related protein